MCNFIWWISLHCPQRRNKASVYLDNSSWPRLLSLTWPSNADLPESVFVTCDMNPSPPSTRSATIDFEPQRFWTMKYKKMIVRLFLGICSLTFDKSFSFPLQPLAAYNIFTYVCTGPPTQMWLGLVRSPFPNAFKGPSMESLFGGRKNDYCPIIVSWNIDGCQPWIKSYLEKNPLSYVFLLNVIILGNKWQKNCVLKPDSLCGRS